MVRQCKRKVRVLYKYNLYLMWRWPSVNCELSIIYKIQRSFHDNNARQFFDNIKNWRKTRVRFPFNAKRRVLSKKLKTIASLWIYS